MEGENGNEVTMVGEAELAASLEEMERLDAVLKIKVAEERRAKLSRIQTEEESRDVLSKLRCSKLPDRIQVNVEQFMKLLNEVEKTEADASLRIKSDDVHGVVGIEPENEEEREDGKTIGRQQNTKAPTFVQRNILLAKCGRGTLSLTDEEKSRIANLLVNIEDTEWKTCAKMPQENQIAEIGSENNKELYAVDDQTTSILGEIDQRLEALAKLKTPKGLKSETERKKNHPEKNGADENGERNRGRGRRKEKKGSRLEEINKMLNSMNSASEEEVNPLAEEELERLLRESSSEETGGERLRQEVVSELVSSAKLLMPKFRYRFDES